MPRDPFPVELVNTVAETLYEQMRIGGRPWAQVGDGWRQPWIRHARAVLAVTVAHLTADTPPPPPAPDAAAARSWRLRYDAFGNHDYSTGQIHNLQAVHERITDLVTRTRATNIRVVETCDRVMTLHEFEART